MIDSRQLLDIARELSSVGGRRRPRVVALRRSISTAYYALFHWLLRASADLLIGATEPRERYTLAYRALDYGRMKSVCSDISKNNLGYSFGSEIKRCTAPFVELQDSRHKADYDPSARFTLSDARAAITKAEDAIGYLETAPEAEARLLLTLLHFRPRS